jgi:hypothetical protein
MDDFVIFAPTRHKLRAAIRQGVRGARSAQAPRPSGETLYRPHGQGVRFLGYRLRTGAKRRPAQLTIVRLITPARRRKERGAGPRQLRLYLWRWYRWLLGGLRGRVSTKGRFTRIWVLVLRRLHLTDQPVHPR